MATDSVFTFYLPYEYTIQVATGTLDVHISCRPVQLDAETALITDCGNYQSVETITNNSEKIRSHNEKACLWLLSYKISKKFSLPHVRACVWQLS